MYITQSIVKKYLNIYLCAVCKYIVNVIGQIILSCQNKMDSLIQLISKYYLNKLLWVDIIFKLSHQMFRLL